MAKTLLVLEEVLAALEVVGVSRPLRDKFHEQATAMLQHKARGQAPDDGTDTVTVNSGYGTITRRGFVELTVNDQLTQMDVPKAREIGLMLIQAAEAATSDEVFMKLLHERVGIDDPQRLGAMLMDLRELRQGSKDVVFPS